MHLKKQRSLLFFCFLCFAASAQTPSYPATRMVGHRDTLFHRSIADPYRWLEDTQSPEVKAWVEAQNKVTDTYLKKAAVAYNSWVNISHYAETYYNNPIKQHQYYFTYAYKEDVAEPALFYQRSLQEDPTLLLDPSFISRTDVISLGNYSVSGDSHYLAYLFHRNGNRQAEIKALDLRTGHALNDQLQQVSDRIIAWRANGFYYSHSTAQDSGNAGRQQVFYHRLGTEQSEDSLIFQRKDHPEYTFSFHLTADERFFFIRENQPDRNSYNIYYVDFTTEDKGPKPLLTRMKIEDDIKILDNENDTLIAYTDKGGANGMLVKIGMQNPRQWKMLIPVYSQARLTIVRILKERILCVYEVNGKQQIIFYDRRGKLLQAIPLPFGITVDGFYGDKTDQELVFSYTGFTTPTIGYCINVKTFKLRPLSGTLVNFDYQQFETKELEYETEEGTKIPLAILHKKGIQLTGKNQTILNTHVGFGRAIKMQFDPGIVHFLMNGGLYVYTGIGAGGNEKALDEEGTVPDHFIQVAEFLIRERYTHPQKLAITGEGYDGLMAAIVMTRRPDLFKVCVPVAAPLDLLRSRDYTIGPQVTDKAKHQADSLLYQTLLKLSPLQHLDPAKKYPATFLLTSENDAVVPPFHAYKFAAALQQTKLHSPFLLRVQEKSGHTRIQKSWQSFVREISEQYDFILYNLNKEE